MERRGLNIRKRFLRAFMPIFRAFPLPVASRFVSGIGRMEYRWSKRLRTSFRSAVNSGRLMLDCDWDVQSVSRELAGNHVLWRTRDLLLDGVPDDRARNMFTVTGRENLDAAIGQGRGCIVLASHFARICYPPTGSSARTFLFGSTWNVPATFRVTWRGILRRVGRWGKTSFLFRDRGRPPIRPARYSEQRGRSRPECCFISPATSAGPGN